MLPNRQRTILTIFYCSDGYPVPEATPHDRQELTKAMMRYKNNLESAAQRAKAAKHAMVETKAKVHKLHTVVKTAHTSLSVAVTILQKKQLSSVSTGGTTVNQFDATDSTDRVPCRVNDVFSALRTTAARGQ